MVVWLIDRQMGDAVSKTVIITCLRDMGSSSVNTFSPRLQIYILDAFHFHVWYLDQ